MISSMDGVCFPWDHPVDVDGAEWWIVWDDEGEPVGYAALSVRPNEPGVGYLRRVGVLPSARGQGLGRRLLRARIARARALGLTTLLTDTTTANVASANNLIGAGFRLFLPEYAWAGHEGVLYWRLDV